MLVFGENDSHRLSNFLQTHIFWNFDHISRIYNQINYRNIWFPKVIIILIMTAQVLFLMRFPKKTRTLLPHLMLIKWCLPWVSNNVRGCWGYTEGFRQFKKQVSKLYEVIFLTCKSMYILQVYSIDYTLR